ncbi:hypothetical protein GCM10009092_45570 [Bowmanella denitrificans]|uniref:HTH araC/xylS-type domain-containing protein n=1 Tax=Bowmanella denitrificans TaxID=366582 RepID=A0ABN0XXY0_9ALTE
MLYFVQQSSMGCRIPVPEKNAASLPKIRRNAVTLLGQILSKSGLCLQDMLRKSGLDNQDTLDIVDFLRLLESFAIEVCDESLHMSKRPLLPGTNDHVLSHLGKCHNLQNALQELAASYNFIHGGAYNKVERRDREILYIIDDRQFPYLDESQPEHIRFNLDCVLLYVHGVVCALGGHSAAHSLVKVQSRADNGDNSVLQAAFGHLPLKFGASCYVLHYQIGMADHALQWQAPLTLSHVYNQLQFHLGQNNAGHLVRRVRGLLETGIQSQDAIASELGYSVATLRRKLAESQSSFRQCREQVLNQEAKTLLARHLSLEEVALRLHFSDARSFNRAFKTWNGITPRDYIDSLAKSN